MASPLIARYFYTSGALTSDSTGNGNTLSNSNVTAKYIYYGGGGQFVSASSSSSTVPINFTKSAVTSIMGVFYLDDSPAVNDSLYGVRYTTGGDSDRSLLFASPNWTQVRYDASGTGITNIPVTVGKLTCFAYIEDGSGGTFYVENLGPFTEAGTKNYANLTSLVLGCRDNNGVYGRFVDATLADIQLFNTAITNAYFKNYCAYKQGVI